MSRPPALPPETRTVGQLVAESIRLYGRRFWPSLGLGLSVAMLDQLAVSLDDVPALLVAVSAGAVLLSVTYALACTIVAEASLTRHSFAIAVAVGAVAFVPVPFLVLAFILPAVAWLALVGLAVPAAVIERLSFRAALRRGVALARADYVHALGSLATLAIVYFLTRTALLFTLRGQAETTLRTAAFLADVVVSPLLFLGAALLYVDQEARLRRRASAQPRA